MGAEEVGRGDLRDHIRRGNEEGVFKYSRRIYSCCVGF